jgi:hypothetical protein
MVADLAVAITLWTADYLQTRTIPRDPSHWYESEGGPWHLMGRHPSQGRINAYFGAGAIAIGGMYVLLPKPWNHVAMGLVIVQETVNIRSNLIAGVKFTF